MRPVSVEHIVDVELVTWSHIKERCGCFWWSVFEMLTLRQKKKWNHCFSFSALAAQHLKKQKENRLTCCSGAKMIPLNYHIWKIVSQIARDYNRLTSSSVFSVVVKLQLLPRAAVWPHNFPVWRFGKCWKNGGKADNRWWEWTNTFYGLFPKTWGCWSDCLVRLSLGVGSSWEPWGFPFFLPYWVFSHVLDMIGGGTEQNCSGTMTQYKSLSPLLQNPGFCSMDMLCTILS